MKDCLHYFKCRQFFQIFIMLTNEVLQMYQQRILKNYKTFQFANQTEPLEIIRMTKINRPCRHFAKILKIR